MGDLQFSTPQFPPRRIRGQTVIALGPAFGLRQQVIDLCDSLGALLRGDYEGNSLDSIRLMVGMGMGIAFLPALYVRSEIGPDDSDVAIVPLEGPRILRSIGLATRKHSADEAAQLVAGIIQGVVREVFAGTLVHEMT